MNGGYVIITDKLTNKITGPGKVSYDGAFNYAAQLISTKKQLLIEINFQGTIVISSVVAHVEGNGISLSVPSLLTIKFKPQEQNSFEVVFEK